METIMERKSVRSYTKEAVDPMKVREVLRLAGQAPSWKNMQPWRFILVEDPQTKEALASCVPEGNPGRPSLTQAPLVVAMLGNPEESGCHDDKDYYLVDCGIAFATLMLAAKSNGLDTCFVGFVDEKRALDVLGVPAPYKLIGLTPLGYGATPPLDKTRRRLEDNTSLNQFGKEIS